MLWEHVDCQSGQALYTLRFSYEEDVHLLLRFTSQRDSGRRFNLKRLTGLDKQTTFQLDPFQVMAELHVTRPEILFPLLLAGHASLAVLEAKQILGRRLSLRARLFCRSIS